jgi:hypothetical protein
MTKLKIVLVGTIIAVSALLGDQPARANGECAKIINVEERLVCLEKKADFMHDNIGSVLKNRKISSSTRPGQCLTWVDNGQSPRTVNCEQPDNRWNLE